MGGHGSDIKDRLVATCKRSKDLRRAGIAMEHSVFLTDNKLLNLATTGSDGYPHVVPVAFMLHEGRLYISTGKKSQKTNNIRADSHVAFAVEDSTRLKQI